MKHLVCRESHKKDFSEFFQYLNDAVEQFPGQVKMQPERPRWAALQEAMDLLDDELGEAWMRGFTRKNLKLRIETLKTDTIIQEATKVLG